MCCCFLGVMKFVVGCFVFCWFVFVFWGRCFFQLLLLLLCNIYFCGITNGGQNNNYTFLKRQ